MPGSLCERLADSLSPIFSANFTERGEIGASLSIWQHGEEIVSLADGFADRPKTRPWTHDTRVLVWSATKGVAAGTTLAVLEREKIALERPVADFWPAFAAGGKSQISLAQVLSHQAGLCGLRNPSVHLLDHAAVAAALAEQEPLWLPGSRHGYHTRTFGFLLDEILRQITGTPLAQLWQDIFAIPLGLDFWIGLPDELVSETAPIYPARNPAGLLEDDFWRAMARPDSLTRLAFGTPVGLTSVASMNTAEARKAALPAMGGVGTAQALGKWYAMLANGGKMDGVSYLSPATIEKMSTTLTSGPDAVMLQPTAFSAGFMQDPVGPIGKIRHLFGPSLQAFGHPGAGGSHAFADPVNGISFAYVMNQMELGIFPNAKSLRLVEAIYRDL